MCICTLKSLPELSIYYCCKAATLSEKGGCLPSVINKRQCKNTDIDVNALWVVNHSLSLILIDCNGTRTHNHLVRK